MGMEMMGGLCDELLVEILDRIPLKQVISMRCLSKSWCSFISRYRKSRPRVSSSTLLIQYGNHVDRDQNQVMFFQAKEKPEEEGGVRVEKLLGYPIDEHINFRESSNGLLLFNQFVHPYKLIAYVCNPASKQWQWDALPPLFRSENFQQSIQIRMGLAFDGLPNHPYKVVSYTRLKPDGDLEFQIYSSDTQEWRKQIQRIPRSSLLPQQFSLLSEGLNIHNPHLFWKGMLLCIAKPEGKNLNENLLVYHIQNNLFKLMRLPKGDEHPGYRGFLWESQGYLHYCLNVEDGFCLWKYADYNFSWETFANAEKWNLINTVNIGTLVSLQPGAYGPFRYLKLFQACAFDEGLQILYIVLRTAVISYSFETRRSSKVWTFEQGNKLSLSSLPFQLNGTNCPLGGDSIWSLPNAEPQGPPIMG